MFESALNELLAKHGLLDAWFHGPDVNNGVTPFKRTQALEIQQLFTQFAEELSAFDKRILALHYRCKCAAAATAVEPQLFLALLVSVSLGDDDAASQLLTDTTPPPAAQPGPRRRRAQAE